MCNSCCKIASKIIMFQEDLQFKDAIILCYIKENIVKIIRRVPTFLTWHISQKNEFSFSYCECLCFEPI